MLASVPKARRHGQRRRTGTADKAIVVERLAGRSDDAAHAHRRRRAQPTLSSGSSPRLRRAHRSPAPRSAGATARLEFHDLLVLARDLLRDRRRGPRRAARSATGALLVDEFQDTDPIQLEHGVCCSPRPTPTPRRRRWRRGRARARAAVLRRRPQAVDLPLPRADIARVRPMPRTHFDASAVDPAHPQLPLGAAAYRVGQRGVRDLIGDGAHEPSPPTAPGGHRDRAAPRARPVVLARWRGRRRPIGEVPRRRGRRPRRAHARPATRAGRSATARRAERRPAALTTSPSSCPPGPRCRTSSGRSTATGCPTGSRAARWCTPTDEVRDLLAVLRASTTPATRSPSSPRCARRAFGCGDDDLVEFRSAGGRWDHRRDRPEASPATTRWPGRWQRCARYHEVRNWRPVARAHRAGPPRAAALRADLRRAPAPRPLAAPALRARPGARLRRRRRRHRSATWRWADLQTAEDATVVETIVARDRRRRGAHHDRARAPRASSSRSSCWPAWHPAAHRQLGGGLWGATAPEVAVGAKDRRFATARLGRRRGRSRRAPPSTRRPACSTSPPPGRATTSWSACATSRPAPATPRRWPRRWPPTTRSPGSRRTVDLGDQLTLPVGDGLLQQPPAIDHDGARRLARRPRPAARGRRRGAGAVGHRDREAGPAPRPTTHDDGDDGDDELVVDGPRRRPPADAVAGRGAPRRHARGRAVHAVLQSVDLDHLDDPAGLEALAALEAAAEGIGSSARRGHRARSIHPRLRDPSAAACLRPAGGVR